MAWLYILAAACIEISIFTLAKMHGFTKPHIMALMAGGAVGVIFVMSLALKTLPLGTAYAAFVALAIIGTTISGIFFFHEPTSLPRLVLIGVVLAGIIGLRLLENPAPPVV